jgi:hypothetical protein
MFDAEIVLLGDMLLSPPLNVTRQNGFDDLTLDGGEKCRMSLTI